MTVIAYQGAPGAFSEEAVLYYDASATPLPCESFQRAINAVLERRADYAMLPVENSSIGPIHSSRAALNNSRVRILKHIDLPIHHCVIGLTSDLAEVKKIISHPAALAQCRRFLSEHVGVAVEEWYDTAGAARDVANGGDVSVAAIAPRRCAELLGLQLLRENVEDNPDNRTTFVLVGR